MAVRIYADHNATSPIRPRAAEAMAAALQAWANPSSVHADGRRARALLEQARETIAGALALRAREIVFTSGATEALQLACEAARAAGVRKVLLSPLEHEAVWAYAPKVFEAVEVLPVLPDGTVDLPALRRALEPERGALLVLQSANNETGVIQPLRSAAALVREHGGYLLCDAVQSLGRAPSEAFAAHADWTVVSSHKIGGPVGCGILALSPGAPEPLTRPGGGQEGGRRAGTENVVACVGFAAALEDAIADLASYGERTAIERDRFESLVASAVPDVVVFGEDGTRLPNTSCVAAPGFAAEMQVIALDLAGASVSAGAACSSGKVKASRALAAICAVDPKRAPLRAGEAIRVSFGWSSRPGDGEALAKLYIEMVERQRARRGAGNV
jgi:cysteine desulfurase